MASRSATATVNDGAVSKPSNEEFFIYSSYEFNHQQLYHVSATCSGIFQQKKLYHATNISGMRFEGFHDAQTAPQMSVCTECLKNRLLC